MSDSLKLELEELLKELELDVQLCTTREQLIRATQRVLKLKRALAQTVELDAQPEL